MRKTNTAKGRDRVKGLLSAGVVLLMTLLIGCGDSGTPAPGVGTSGAVVGGPCTLTDGCSGGSVCQVSGDFPGGSCTKPCDKQADCPDGTACISEKSGVCILSCNTAADCRPGYACEVKSLEASTGEAKVCIN